MTSTVKSTKKTSVKPVPAGYHTATPYMIVNNASKAMEFYKKAFGATEVLRMADHHGKVQHGEIRIGDSVIMLADERPEMGARSPQSIGGSPVSIYLYVEDVDAVVKQAVAAGAKLVRPVEDQFYGDRSGGVEDPFGYSWYVATHKEDLTPEEISKRAPKPSGGCCGS